MGTKRKHMIKIALIAVAAIALSGCAAISKLPSFEHCDQVQYSRSGTAVTVSASCTAGVAF